MRRPDRFSRAGAVRLTGVLVAAVALPGDVRRVGRQKVANTEVTHWREKDNVLREPSGAFVLRFVASSSTCEPSPNACTPSVGGGA